MDEIPDSLVELYCNNNKIECFDIKEKNNL
jgi:hypothetical protein